MVKQENGKWRYRKAKEISPLQCAGLNRHEAENAKFLRERSSDPLGPESCAATVRDSAKRRQGDRRGGRSRFAKMQTRRPRLCYGRKATCTCALARCPRLRSGFRDPTRPWKLHAREP